MSPPPRHYHTRRSLTMAGASFSKAQKSGSGPPKKKAKVSEPIDLTESSLELESEPQPSQPPVKKPSRLSHQLRLLSDFNPSLGIPSICYRALGVEERSFAGGIVQDIRGILFGPHHLIMAALLYFEEKVHRKKLLRADSIPLLFPRLLCQILEHLGYRSDPQLERRCICREIFTLDKWTSMAAYGVVLAEPIPEVTPSALPTTTDSPVIPPTSEPSPSSEPRIAIPFRMTTLSCSSGADYRHSDPTYCHPEADSAPSGIISAPKHAILIQPEPSQALSLVEQTLPSEAPTTREVEASEPSSPHHPPATI
ncbi:hypothetical protein CK203_087670 [Vitis vinifera]|uniref:Uncharacterized protein n=1 Tax=Vitis vinifera TaxID=29760 RepID=A0A438C759_VITVI|nr:hypothetical protein CK203_087670 [Vitis vinifera]